MILNYSNIGIEDEGKRAQLTTKFSRKFMFNFLLFAELFFKVLAYKPQDTHIQYTACKQQQNLRN
jgi:hypothetical protein